MPLGFDFGGINMPSFGIGTGKITIVLTIFITILIGAIIAYLIYDRRIFNKRIIVFENISGQGYQLVFKDRARLISLGSGGEELLYLKRRKKYRTAYGKKMGKNTYWFAIGQDGYWYNVVLGDIDAKMGMLDIEPIDRDMRYMHVAIRKNIQDRYRKTKFMEKYGTIIMNGMFLLIILVGIWFLLDKIAEIAGGISNAIDLIPNLIQEVRQLTSALSNACGGSSSGVIPA